MAGIGPAPKDPSRRTRTRRAARRARSRTWVARAPRPAPIARPAPSAGSHPGCDVRPARTREWWQMWVDSPQAEHFGQSTSIWESLGAAASVGPLAPYPRATGWHLARWGHGIIDIRASGALLVDLNPGHEHHAVTVTLRPPALALRPGRNRQHRPDDLPLRLRPGALVRTPELPRSPAAMRRISRDRPIRNPVRPDQPRDR